MSTITPTSTFEILKALHGIIGDGLDDIERVLAQPRCTTPPPTCYSTPPTSPSTPHKPTRTHSHHYQTPTPRTSPPQSPCSPPLPLHGLDFPSLDAPAVPGWGKSEAELLISTSPIIGAAINRIVSACGQLGAIVRDPFLSLCDASMGVRAISRLIFLGGDFP
jgi:hypothetical protein